MNISTAAKYLFDNGFLTEEEFEPFKNLKGINSTVYEEEHLRGSYRGRVIQATESSSWRSRMLYQFIIFMMTDISIYVYFKEDLITSVQVIDIVNNQTFLCPLAEQSFKI